MQEPSEIISKGATGQRFRPPQEGICPTKSQRDRLRSIVCDYIKDTSPAGPFSGQELRGHADRVISIAQVEHKYKEYIAVLINNELWRDRVAGIPFKKRLLLLPQCLRDQEKCQAEIDEFGLICGHCGNCLIDDLQSQAERLGYVVMVAEGSPMVMALIESGQVEAVVGVSCLAVLEEVFPYMVAGAVPGLAIPLLQDGCCDTSMDLDWVWDAIELSSADQMHLPDLQELRTQVNAWFTEPALAKVPGPPASETEKIAQRWLAKSGKRWRPFLTAGVRQTLQNNVKGPLPPDLRKLAVAVECFHKASLIHDDIEDNDARRYGEKTIHEQYGIPIALNVGDFLLGEGYRLIGDLDVAVQTKEKILQVAAAGHRSLCLGQGAELWWLSHKRPLSVGEVVEIFRQKTAPAFEVALQFGAIYAGADAQVQEVLHRYSEALGIAYQIRDDLDDIQTESRNPGACLCTQQPSILPAVAYKRAGRDDKTLLQDLWSKNEVSDTITPKLDDLWKRLKVEAVTRDLLETYKNQAICVLSGLKNTDLKSMLRRVINKIFNDVEVMSCCNDYQAGNAPSGPAGQKSAE